MRHAAWFYELHRLDYDAKCLSNGFTIILHVLFISQKAETPCEAITKEMFKHIVNNTRGREEKSRNYFLTLEKHAISMQAAIFLSSFAAR